MEWTTKEKHDQSGFRVEKGSISDRKAVAESWGSGSK